jgi:hypothetical protein
MQLQIVFSLTFLGCSRLKFDVESKQTASSRIAWFLGLAPTELEATGIFLGCQGTRRQSYSIEAQASISPSRTSTFNEFPINLHNHDYPRPILFYEPIPQDKALTRGISFTMVLEAVMVVVDNSESSRNGDYTPTRFEAQSDAVSLIFSAITQANPESSVGLMSMGGKGPEVLVTLTTDHGKILEGLHRTKSKIRGDSHLTVAIQIAQVRPSHPVYCLFSTEGGKKAD